MILILSFFAFQVLAQKSGKDVVYLRNGDRYHGNIISWQKDSFMVFRSTEGIELTIPDAMVVRIQMGSEMSYEKPALSKLKNKSKPGALSGLFVQSQSQLAFGGSHNGDLLVGAGLHLMAGYQWKPALCTALGFGVDSYSTPETMLPLFAEVRGYWPLSKNWLTYAGFAGGYSFALTNEEYAIDVAEGGWMWHPSIGLSKITDNASVSFDLGMKRQSLYYERNFSEDYFEKVDILFRRIAFRFGLTFWLKKD